LLTSHPRTDANVGAEPLAREEAAITLETSEAALHEAQNLPRPGKPDTAGSGRLRLWMDRLDAFFGAVAPKGLYTRTLIIIVAPIMILQSILALVFLDRHWQVVTSHLTVTTAQDIAMLADSYDLIKGKGQAELDRLGEMAGNNLGLTVRFGPPEEMPITKSKPFFAYLDRRLSDQLRFHVHRPYWIDTVGSSALVEIRVKLDGAVMRVMARRAQLMPSNTHIFLVWMMVSSAVLLLVAILFLRNQIRPIQSLADAVDRFGRGQPAPPGFRIRGAREVRLAAQAFLEMRDRIERHVEQRTIMLAGVSHDLRTILTRFRLQLAMMDDAQAGSLKRDVDEMAEMLEDYMAFAKGASGEKVRQVDVKRMLQEVQTGAAAAGKTITLEVRQDPLVVAVRRNAFKRAAMNLVSNALRFSTVVSIRALRSKGWLTITVDDNGPGIPADKREQVFRPFHSLNQARNQNVKSTGLGLAITRDIVRGHGGEITLDSSALGGLRAVIRIPLQRAEDA
jgi:two-component system, OmpR family, osmolarity sensor histidine kinase EnvZ